MTATLRIADGNPPWASDAIIPSRDTVISPATSPLVAAVNVNSTDVFVYVNVENAGTVDFSVCPCAATLPVAWAAAPPFSGFIANPTQTLTETHGAFVFQADPGGDTLTGPGFNHALPFGSGRRAWAFSPDDRMFAYVLEPGGLPSSTGESFWIMGIIALQPLLLSDGTTAPIGAPLVEATGSFDGSWTQNQFGWAGSRAVVAHGPAWGQFSHYFLGAPSAAVFSVVCPLFKDASMTNYPPGGATWNGKKSFATVITGTTSMTPPFPHQDLVDWVHVVSPCGSHVAIVPRILDPSAPAQTIVLVDTTSGREVGFRRNNAAIGDVQVLIASPTITTHQASANGVDILTGPANTITTVDDPECARLDGGIVVRVDRVKASTLPTANLGVLPIGVSAAGPLAVGQNRWVQVINANGWLNQSEPHWCLLAEAYAADGTTVPRPWFGDAMNPPPFPVALDNCAQRNIEILP